MRLGRSCHLETLRIEAMRIALAPELVEAAKQSVAPDSSQIAAPYRIPQ
jgi:hypothetical protein